MAYTVDEVSEKLDVPRPTLYRYLREYSIPHHRRAGKIYVPEDSFERIKEVRELHREGLGTESVRRRLLEGEGEPPDVEGLKERLDRISEALEDLRGDPQEGHQEHPRSGPQGGARGESRPVAVGDPPRSGSQGEVVPARALQTVLARQSLLIWAVFNLTEMLEELLIANGGRRRSTGPGAADGDRGRHERPGEGFAVSDEPTVETRTVLPTGASSLVPPASPRRGRRFGALAQRRRRGAIAALLLALLTGAALLATGTADEEGTRAAPREEPREEPAAPPEAPASDTSDEADTGGAGAAPPDGAVDEREGPAVYEREDDGIFYAPEQPFDQAPYQTQDPGFGVPGEDGLPQQEAPIIP